MDIEQIQGADLFDLAQDYSQEVCAARDAAAGFVEQERSGFAELYEQGAFPAAWPAELADLGLLNWVAREGGLSAGDNSLAFGLVNQELEAGDSGLRSFVSVQSGLVQFPIAEFGTDEQKQRWLPGLTAGEISGCFALTEPNHGSDPASMETVAEPVEGGFRIRGAKRWITNGQDAAVMILWARNSETDKIIAFAIPTDTPGIQWTKIERKLSLRISNTYEANFDVQVDASALLPGARSLGTALKCLNVARYGIAWGSVGVLRRCLEIAIAYTKDRKQFGVPLASKQLVQRRIVQMYSDYVHCQLLVHQIADAYKNGTVRPQMISLAKRDCVSKALEAARSARHLLGANGTLGEYEVLRHASNLETVNTYEGTEDVHTMILGQFLTGESAF
jgi:glutaryl-CoA dehydrogenase